MIQKKRLYQCIAGSCFILLCILAGYRVSVAEKQETGSGRLLDIRIEGTKAYVDTYKDFQAALQNTNISEIELEADIERPAGYTNADNPGTIYRDLKISGGSRKYTLSLAPSYFYPSAISPLATVNNSILLGTGGGTLRLEHLKYGNVNGNACIDALDYGGGWSIELADVEAAAGSQKSLVYAPRAEVEIEGAENRFTYDTLGTVHTYGNAVRAKGIAAASVRLAAGAKVDITAAGTGYAFEIGKSLYLEEGAELGITAAGNTYTQIYFPESGGELIAESDAGLKIDNKGTNTILNDYDDDHQLSCGIFGYLKEVSFYGGSKTELNTAAAAFRILEEGSFQVTNKEYRNGGLTGKKITEEETVMDIGAESNGISMRPLTPLGDPETGIRTILFEGEGTKVSIDSKADKISRAAYTGAVVIAGEKGTCIEVEDKAQVDILAARNPERQLTTGIFMSGEGEENSIGITVGKGARLGVESSAGAAGSAAVALSVSDGSGAYINVEGGKLDVAVKNMDGVEYVTQPAVRMFGGNNTIHVTDGGKLNVIHEGAKAKGTSTNLTAAGNQAILYEGGTVRRENTFLVEGEGSEVAIDADMGPAICSLVPIRITVEKGANFWASADTAESGSMAGTFVSSSYLRVAVNEPNYFDFKNKNAKANLFQCTSAAGSISVMNIRETALGLWEKGSDLEGQPDYSHKKISSLTAEGANFSGEMVTNPEWPEVSGIKISDISRMTANNGVSEVNQIRIPTTADARVYVHARVPEGAQGNYRDAWTGEVKAEVKVTRAQGSTAPLHAAVESVGMVNGTGLSAFGQEKEAGGWCELDLGRYWNDKFLHKGDQVAVAGVWRGEAGSLAEAEKEEAANEIGKNKTEPAETQEIKILKGISQEEVSYTGEVYKEQQGFADIPVPLVEDTVRKIGGTIQDTEMKEQLENYSANVELAVYVDGVEKSNIRGSIKKENGNWNWSADFQSYVEGLKEGQEIGITLRHKTTAIEGKRIEPQDYKRLSSENGFQEYVEKEKEWIAENNWLERVSCLEEVEGMSWIRKGVYESPDKKWKKNTAYTQEVKFHDKTYQAELKFYVIEGDGQLELIVPEQINFGTYEITPEMREDRITLFNEGVKVTGEESYIGVKDTRKVKGDWVLNIKLNEEMTEKETKTVLHDILVYNKGDGSGEYPLDKQNGIKIAERNPGKDLLKISDEWYTAASGGRGLYLAVKPNQVKKGSYSGSILWEFVIGP